MKLIRVTAPDGYALGWISPDLILSINPTGRYIKYRDGDRVRDAMVDAEKLRHQLRVKKQSAMLYPLIEALLA